MCEAEATSTDSRLCKAVTPSELVVSVCEVTRLPGPVIDIIRDFINHLPPIHIFSFDLKRPSNHAAYILASLATLDVASDQTSSKVARYHVFFDIIT